MRLDADAAWLALGERRPDLVLLDVNLPGASGLDWLRRVRAAPEHAGLAVALYTHWGLPADVAAGLDAGVDFVFDKDLATRPADWQRRLLEIGEAGRTGKSCGAWPNAGSALRWKREDGRPFDAGVGGRLQSGLALPLSAPADGGSAAGFVAPGLDTGARAARYSPIPLRRGSGRTASTRRVCRPPSPRPARPTWRRVSRNR